MSPVVHLVVTLVVCMVLVRPLAGARWVWRAPRVGVLVWQMLTVAWVLCVVGIPLVVGLAGRGPDVPGALGRWVGALAHGEAQGVRGVVTAVGCVLAGVLAGTVLVRWVAVGRTRRRHRAVLALVAREEPGVPGALVLDHPVAVAYCLPGLRARVVLSSGALRVLSPAEVVAVLAHERTHARERHDLVLLPFTALRRLVPRSRLMACAAEAVALLVEMCADEAVCARYGRRSLAGALRCFGSSALVPPAGTLGIASGAVAVRLARITSPAPPLPAVVRYGVLLGGLVLVSTPVSFLLP